MARIDGGEMLVRVLVQHGVREVFTLHGGHLDAIYQAAGDRLRFIDTRHEQAAGHAADGWARTTGRLGVAIVTAGPGVTDVVTAVANAYLDAVPTLFLGGAAPLRDAETLPLQGGLDQVAMLRPITKWAVRITHTRRLPDLLAQAIRVATTGRPGPVFVEIPIDVLFAREDEAKAVFPAPLTPTRPAPPDAAVQGAIAALAAAERPLILAGGGVWFSAAADALRAFAERTGIPVATNGKAHGTLPPEHPACAGSVATIAALARTGTPPDTVLVLGARLGLFTGGRGGFLAAARHLIQVDVEPEEIGRNHNVDLAICADCRETILALDAAAGAQTWPDRTGWQATVHAARGLLRGMFTGALEATTPPIHPYRLAHEVAAAAGPDAVLVDCPKHFLTMMKSRRM